MTSNKTTGSSVYAALLAAGLGLAVAGCGQSPEPGATDQTFRSEIPGTHASNDLNPVTAQRWIDQVRLGRGVDHQGQVPDAMRTDTFTHDDEINVSVKVSDAPVGTHVALEIHNGDSGEIVWTDERSVDTDHSHLTFRFSADDLESGSYEARVIVGDERVARSLFAIG